MAAISKPSSIQFGENSIWSNKWMAGRKLQRCGRKLVIAFISKGKYVLFSTHVCSLSFLWYFSLGNTTKNIKRRMEKISKLPSLDQKYHIISHLRINSSIGLRGRLYRAKRTSQILAKQSMSVTVKWIAESLMVPILRRTSPHNSQIAHDIDMQWIDA